MFRNQRSGRLARPGRAPALVYRGTEDEREAYDKREYVPHWLDVDTIDAEELDVIKAKGELSV